MAKIRMTNNANAWSESSRRNSGNRINVMQKCNIIRIDTQGINGEQDRDDEIELQGSIWPRTRVLASNMINYEEEQTQ